jgi:hypothetical protein
LTLLPNERAVILEESYEQAGLQAKQAFCFINWMIFNQKILPE